jgi:hypothetical protein
MAGIRVGKPDVAPDTPSHTKGVGQGNRSRGYGKEAGQHPDGTADARRSTGVNPEEHDPILPIMPNLPPG